MACTCYGKRNDAELSGNVENNQDGEERLCSCCDSKAVGKFGLAWVVDFPNSPYSEPLGWQVELSGTAEEVTAKCNEIINWVSAPPLPQNQLDALKPEPPNPCRCCKPSNNRNMNIDPYSDYYNNNNVNQAQCNCPMCQTRNQNYCTRCQRCKAKPPVESISVNPTPPDIFKTSQSNIQDNRCSCSRGSNCNMFVKSVNCDPKCSQGILRKCKSYPVAKRNVRNCSRITFSTTAQDNTCQCYAPSKTPKTESHTISLEPSTEKVPLEVKPSPFEVVKPESKILTPDQSNVNAVKEEVEDTEDYQMVNPYISFNEVDIVSLTDK